jgi:hypothetical protein
MKLFDDSGPLVLCKRLVPEPNVKADGEFLVPGDVCGREIFLEKD